MVARLAQSKSANREGGVDAAKVAVARRRDRAKRQNDLLDEGLKETFPASDPVSIIVIE
jgi:hypothetical protein